MKRVCLIAVMAYMGLSLAFADESIQKPFSPGKIALGHYLSSSHRPEFSALSRFGKTVDSIWFTSNGLPTVSSTQGEMLTWACNCLANDTLDWEIWVDGGNGQFDSTAGDIQLFAYTAYNGDTLGSRGLPDTTAAADNEMVQRLKNGFAPALYWLKVTSQIDGSSAVDSLRVTAMASPWATVSGHIHIPQGGGDSTLQANLWIEANLDNDSNEPVFWAALTDSFGDYTINFDDAMADSVWTIGNLNDIVRGDTVFLAPSDTLLVVDAGPHTSVDFAYIPPTDSITGTVVDDLGSPISLTTYVGARQGDKERYVEVEGTHYQLFFAASDTGSWRLFCGWDQDQQSYMSPLERYVTPAGAGHLVEDYTIYRATDSITGRITEQGVPPASSYRLYAYSTEFGTATSISDPGDGHYRLMVCDTGSFSIGIVDWDDDYPVPSGWVSNPSSYNGIVAPDTGINFDLSPATEFITGKVAQDTGDAQSLNFSTVNVQAFVSEGSSIDGTIDSAGNYSISVYPDTFGVRGGASGFLFRPSEYRDIAVAPNDTVDSVNFTANYGHCRLQVILRGYPAGDSGMVYALDSLEWPNGYVAGFWVTDSGPHSMWLCNSSGWRVMAPSFAGYSLDSSTITVGNITHADTLRSIVFTYTPFTEYISGAISQDTGDAQQFNPAQAHVYAWRMDGNNYTNAPDSTGLYMVGVEADTYQVGINWDRANGYFLFKPIWYSNVVVAPSDTAGPYDFTSNFGHCRVSVLLRGYPSGDTNNVNIGDSLAWSGGYVTSLAVSDSGPHDIFICNSNGWQAWPPAVDGFTVDSTIIHLGDISHGDTLRQVVFTYTPTSEYIEGIITQDAGDAQPVNFNNAQVFASYSDGDGSTGFGVMPEGSGFYRIGVVSDSFNIGVRYNNNDGWFLFKPYYQNQFVVPLDTLMGIDFTANQGHCAVAVNLINYPDSAGYLAALDSTGYPSGYMSFHQVSAAGICTLYVCNSNGWYVIPPNLTGWGVNPAYHLIGDITHSDGFRGMYDFTYTYTGVEGQPADRPAPAVFKLSQNSPNPAVGRTRIDYQLPRPARVSLSIYNILGQEIRSYDLGTQQPGYYSLDWDGRDATGKKAAAGVYLYRLQAGEASAVKKMTVVR
jgi:hypothetical protein